MNAHARALELFQQYASLLKDDDTLGGVASFDINPFSSVSVSELGDEVALSRDQVFPI